ncbi:hypothetical protein K443DRAFT_9012, partial [Laccaria amethystina LaAM-08-1]
MSTVNNKSTSLNVSDIPCFNGSNFQGWSEKMIGIFMMAKVYSVVNGASTLPVVNSHPTAPAEPTTIDNTTAGTDLNRLNAMWTQYQVRMTNYNHLLAEYNRKVSTWNDANSQAMGIFSRALQIGIWDQILEHFRYIKDQKIDLSDPNPQLATFMHHYQALPSRIISAPMAAVILLSNLPLTTNPGQESVYQRLLESTLKDEVITTLSLADLMQSIHDVWAARFGGIHPNQQPRRGTTYDKGKAPASKPQQKQQTQVQRNTAIKGKGQQQNAESGDQHTKKKRPFRRRGKGKNAHNHMVGASDSHNSDFVLASAAMHIADTPSLPTPTAHTETSFSAAGPLTRREKSSGPWRNPSNPGGLSPYPHVKCSRDLMSRLGVTPTIQTSKEFEGIASLEEVTDGAFGAPTVKLGAYTLVDPPRAPTPEMAPLTPLVEAMVIDVPSDNEDTVSLGEKEDTFSVHTGIGPNPHYSGLFGDD